MAGVPIQFPTSVPPIALRGNMDRYSIAGFWGPSTVYSYWEGFNQNQANLRNYLRGGAFVPDGPAGNASLPASGTIREQDLLGRYAYLEVRALTHPGTQTVFMPPPSGGVNYSHSWSFILGVSALLSHHSYAHSTWKWSRTSILTEPESPGSITDNSDPNSVTFGKQDTFTVRAHQSDNASGWIDHLVTLTIKSDLTGQTHSLVSSQLRQRFVSLV